jgi:hypothetical protein
MAWSNQQKQIAVRACKAAGISDEQRRDMILRNIDHARLPDGRVTSAAPKLNNADFEQFMAIVEQAAGGQILHFTRDYWVKSAADSLSRLRYKAKSLAAELEAAGHLVPHGVGLAGWIEKRVSQGATNRLEELDYQQLRALIVGLSAYGRQRADPLNVRTFEPLTL